jgi:hypothetical protein
VLASSRKRLGLYPPSWGSPILCATPAASDGSRKTGAFLAFIPEQDTNEIQTVEDGFFLYLTNSAWQKIREDLLSGTDVFVPPARVGDASITVVWAKPAAYTSPVSGETYTAQRWTTYNPETTLPPKERLAVSSSRTVLLTSEHDLQGRTTADDLAGYANLIEKAVDTFFTPLERTNRELAIQLVLTAAGHEVRFIAVPALSADAAEDLQKRLDSVPSPEVSGPVKLDFILSLWSVASNEWILHQPLGFLVNSGTTPGFAKLRSVELVGDELSVPGQQHIRPRDSRQFFQGFPSEPVSDLSQRGFFGIG